MNEATTDRRSFLKKLGTGAVGAGLALSSSTSQAASILRGSPNQDVTIAMIGMGPRGMKVASYWGQLPGVDVRYVCDVDERLIAEGKVAVAEVQNRAAEGVVDFRRILDDPDVDAVSIHAPDHWHAPAAILALQAGKHVYVEKPCSHNPREGELLVSAAQRYAPIVQMGNQRRSLPLEIEAIAAVHDGAIGPVHYARAWYANKRGSIGRGQITEVPSYLDWELWQGPAPRTVYRDNIHPYDWHWFWRWGTGEAGNNGVHVLDIARWGLQVDYPTFVTAAGGRYFWDDDQETPDTQVIVLNFEREKSVMWEGLSSNRHPMGDSWNGVSFHGEEGTLVVLGDAYEIYDRDNKLVRRVGDSEVEGALDLAGGAYTSNRPHLENFRDAITGGEKLNSPIDEGHKSTLLCHLGNIAHRTGRTLTTNPKNGHIQGDEDAMRLWDREYAPGWEPKV